MDGLGPIPENLTLGPRDESTFDIMAYWRDLQPGVTPDIAGARARHMRRVAGGGRGGFTQDTATQMAMLAASATGNYGGMITAALGSTALLGGVMGPFAPLLGLFAGPLNKLFGGGRRTMETVENEADANTQRITRHRPAE
jgi:hypothetical protein